MRTTAAKHVAQLLKCNTTCKALSFFNKNASRALTALNPLCHSRLYSDGTSLEERPEKLAESIAEGVVYCVNERINDPAHGRLFAVVHFAGCQLKITNEDLMVVKTNPYFPDVGERIVLEKVLLAGSEDFTLLGRPLLENVRVEATIIEKTLGYEQVQFMYKRRKNVRKMKIFQELQTVLRINSITINSIEEAEVD